MAGVYDTRIGSINSAFVCFYVLGNVATDGVIQKVKQRYSQAGGPSNGTLLAKVQEGLKATPPRLLSFEEMMQSNGEANGHVDPVPGCGERGSSLAC